MRTVTIAAIIVLGCLMATMAMLVASDPVEPVGVAAAASLPAETAGCRSSLTGRRLTLPTELTAFGQNQRQPALPLAANEYVLTIDDGPNAVTTERLMAILSERCVHATFMMIGDKAIARPDLVRMVVSGGNSIGSHSQTHRNFSTLSPAVRERDILDGVASVDRAAGLPASITAARHLFRVPGGDGVPHDPPPDWLAFFRAHNLVFAGWEWSADDWNNAPAEVSYAKFFPRMGDRGVILLHDGPLRTLELLPMVLDELQRRRARVVTIVQPR